MPEAWRDELEQLTRDVEPAEPGPRYVMWTWEVEDYFELAPGIAGFTSGGLAFELRGLLEHQGRWRGPGFAAILDFDAWAGAWESITGAVLHEYGHHAVYHGSLAKVAAVRSDCHLPPVDDQAGLAQEFTRRTPPRRPTRITGESGLACHGPAWIRLCIHLAHRVGRHPMDIIVTHHLPTPVIAYAKALGNEPEEMKRRRLAEIAATKPPRRFRALAAKDASQAPSPKTAVAAGRQLDHR